MTRALLHSVAMLWKWILRKLLALQQMKEITFTKLIINGNYGPSSAERFWYFIDGTVLSTWYCGMTKLFAYLMLF